MKKSILTLVALGAAVSVMGQGIVNFSTRVSGTVIGHVYDVGGPARTGNTASETPAGTQTYAGALLQGTGFSAALFAANGAGQAEGSLVLVPGSLTTFRTGATLGGTPAPLTLAVPGVAAGGTGTFQIRAWNNGGGLYATYDLAAAANSPVGKSGLFDVANLGDGVLTLPADFANFRSFNLSAVPEPSTFVLAGLGAAALVIFRRRK
jgi:hypothetical protein